jgi:hypothetical protein
MMSTLKNDGMIPQDMEGPLSTVPEHERRKSKKHDKKSHSISSGEECDLDDERRRKKEERRAKRLAKHLAELGLDENGDPIDNFSLLKYPVREWKFKLPGFHEPIALNLVVTFIGVVCLWGMVMWSSGTFSGTRHARNSTKTNLTLSVVSCILPAQPILCLRWSLSLSCAYA